MIRALGAGTVLLLAAIVAMVWQVLTPRVVAPRPGQSDALVVFADGSGDRLIHALELLPTLDGAALVLSGTHWPGEPRDRMTTARVCDEGLVGVEVVCVRAPGDSTHGEAAAFAAIARARGFEHLTVVTSDYHLERAGRWLRRCFDGEVSSSGAAKRAGAHAVLHEVAALVQYAFVDRRCRAFDAELEGLGGLMLPAPRTAR